MQDVDHKSILIVNKRVFNRKYYTGTIMLTLTHCEHDLTANLYLARIRGPKGTLELRELVWIVDRPDILDTYYWSAWAVLQGVYHCCWSIPGKVLLVEH